MDIDNSIKYYGRVALIKHRNIHPLLWDVRFLISEGLW